MGIRTSCKHKREFYLLCKGSNDPLLKNQYKLYCKTLSNVIWEAKKLYYITQTENSKHKMEPVWGITRTLTGIKTKNKEV
jgi:hypothetical protein